MLGGMRHETEHGRRKARAADAAGVDQALPRSPTHLLERAIDAGACIRDDLVEPWGRVGRRAFGPERSLLIGAQRVATRIGEEAIDNSPYVPHVKANGGGSSRFRPHML